MDSPGGADEMTLVRELGVLERKVKERLTSQDQRTRDRLIEELQKEIPDRPDLEFVRQRVMMVLALGRLSSSESDQALEKLLEDPARHRLNEPLQLLRIARLSSTIWESPLAFALRPKVRIFDDVVLQAQSLSRPVSLSDTGNKNAGEQEAGEDEPPSMMQVLGRGGDDVSRRLLSNLMLVGGILCTFWTIRRLAYKRKRK